MRIIDKKALQVDSLLRESYLELSKEVGEYSNIIGVFYHDLMIYITNFIIISHEDKEHIAELDFPFLTSEYVETPYPINFELKEHQVNFKTLLFETAFNLGAAVRKFISRILFVKKKKSIAVASNMNNAEAIGLLFLPLSYELCFCKQRKLFLEKLDYQISFLSDVLSKVFSAVDILPNAVAISNFVNYVKINLTDRLPDCNSDVLFISSPTGITERIQSANYLESSKSVVAFIHGQANVFQWDEPYISYGEYSYATHVLMYGSELLSNSRYIASLHVTAPKIYHRNSMIVSKIHRDDRISSRAINHKSKGLYITNGMNVGNKRYGPFRDINSEEYTKWQKQLMSQRLNLYVKGAPNCNYDNIVSSDKLLSGKLHKNMRFFRDYDYYILDYFSTATTLAVATNRPILYFNLGMRNFSEDVIDDYKKRMFWVDIDLDGDISKQIEEGVGRFLTSKRTYENNITSRYSLHENSTFVAIKNILDEVE